MFFEQCIIQAGLPFEGELSERGKNVFSENEITGPKTAQFVVRIDPYKKSLVEYTFGELGITTSGAVDLYFRKCLCEWGVPFRVGYPKPNAETLAAMAETADESKAYTSHAGAPSGASFLHLGDGKIRRIVLSYFKLIVRFLELLKRGPSCLQTILKLMLKPAV